LPVFTHLFSIHANNKLHIQDSTALVYLKGYEEQRNDEWIILVVLNL
jgi:hypothetical protein